MTTTVRELITTSLRKINAIQPGEQPNDEDFNIAIEALDGMVDSWSNDRLLIYTMNPYYFLATPSKQTYTLGPGGDWDVERPMRIDEAYVMYNADYNVGPPFEFLPTENTAALPIAIANDSQWASIPVKQLETVFPTILYDDGNYPLRNISLYPIPNQIKIISLWLWQPLLSFTSLDDPVSFPPGYERALIFNLAMELAPEYGKTCGETIIRIASDSKMALAAVNSDPQVMGSDRSLGQRGSVWNWIYGDTIPIPR